MRVAWLLGGIAFAVISGCRFSYELLSGEEGAMLDGNGGDVLNGDGDGDGSLGGASNGDGGLNGDGDGDLSTGSTASSSGGDGSGSSSTGGSATGGSGTNESFDGDLIVTIGANEDDAETMGGPPWLGAGLSLREAIKLANSATSPISISINPGLTVNPGATDLPTLVETIELYGNGATIDFSSKSTANECFLIDGGSVSFDNLVIANCSQEPIFFQGGTNHRVSNTVFTGNAKSITTGQSTSGNIIGPGNTFTGGITHAIFLGAPGDLVIDNRFFDTGGSGGAAIFVSGTADGASVIGNLMVRSKNGISFASNGDNVKIWHNTIVSTLSTGIVVGQATGLNIQNNIVSNSGLFGINANSANLAVFDYNLWFNDINCNGCAAGLGDNSILEDPLYNDFAGDDFTLDTTTPSPAVNAGTSTLNEDRNGSDSGNYYGPNPDMGCFESTHPG